MSLNESIVEDAGLEWFLLREGYGGQVGELGHVDGDESLPVQLDVERVLSTLELPFTEPETFWKLP